MVLIEMYKQLDGNVHISEMLVREWGSNDVTCFPNRCQLFRTPSSHQSVYKEALAWSSSDQSGRDVSQKLSVVANNCNATTIK